jgi:hypothetical protein
LRGQSALVVLARVRAALIGVLEQPGLGRASFDRHLERFDREMPVVDRTDGPPDEVIVSFPL